MTVFLHSGWGRALSVLLILVLLFALASIAFHSDPADWAQRLKKLALAVVASVVIGLAASLRGKQELERPWEAPLIGQTQLDETDRTETGLDEEEAHGHPRR